MLLLPFFDVDNSNEYYMKNRYNFVIITWLYRLFSGEKGIRTLGTQCVQRFSRPPRSTTPASLLTALLDRVFHYKGDLRRLAETEGFEPPKPFGLTVFKTAAIDHSAISPLQKYNNFRLVEIFPEKKFPFQAKSLSLQNQTKAKEPCVIR